MTPPPSAGESGRPVPESRRPDAFRGPSARSYLLIALGEHLLDQGDGAWTHTVLDALGVLGFEEKAARQALSRSAAAGWLVSERIGRTVRWRLTSAGREFLRAGESRLFAGPDQDWNGEWLILLADVPENRRRLRRRLRTSLGWAGFGSPLPGVWISPHPSRAKEAEEVLHALRGEVQGTLLHARLDDPGERRRLAGRAWDVSDLDARYLAFIDRFGAVRPDSPRDAFVLRLHMVYEWRRLVLLDPGLPPALLPADWSGARARRLLLDRRAAWREAAHAWWRGRESGPAATRKNTTQH